MAVGPKSVQAATSIKGAAAADICAHLTGPDIVGLFRCLSPVRDDAEHPHPVP